LFQNFEDWTENKKNQSKISQDQRKMNRCVQNITKSKKTRIEMFQNFQEQKENKYNYSKTCEIEEGTKEYFSILFRNTNGFVSQGAKEIEKNEDLLYFETKVQKLKLKERTFAIPNTIYYNRLSRDTCR